MIRELGLQDAKVLVAGAGGLGGACVGGFLDEGADVMVADADSEVLACLEEAPGGTGEVQTLKVDLASADGCRRMVEHATDVLGRIDCFVHAVGINDRRPLLEFDDEGWEMLIRVNLSSAFWLGQAVGRAMCDQGHGKVVYISSVSGHLAHGNHGPYAASKGGMNQLVRVMAREWAASGVQVNAVAPGYTETELTNSYLEGHGVREELTKLVPAGRLGRPDDVVGPVLFLSSPLSDYVTGHVMYVDGGRTLV